MFIKLTDAHGADIDINVGAIDSYTTIGGYTQIMCGQTQYNVLNTMVDIRQALNELYVTLKCVQLEKPNEPRN